MDDNKQEVKQEVKTAETSKPKKNEKDKPDLKKRLTNTFNDYKGEFKKIIWPTPKELAKKTVTVVIVSLMFGLLIFCIDSIYSVGVQYFVQLVTK